METISFRSPIGILEISANENAIVSLYMRNEKEPAFSEITKNKHLKACVKQLHEYFSGKRKMFDLPLEFIGTDFQVSVWLELTQIPFGQTFTYGQIAKNIENPKASRAVGLANNRNPISIIVPCHRVIGANGKMVGYGGGLWRKEWLLKHEGAIL